MRPNILFAFGDDWGRYASIYSKFEDRKSLNNLIKTPNFDKIAEDGVLFLNALVPAPSCTPCRSSILSGQYFWQTGLGAILWGAEWDNSIETFTKSLEENANYFIGYQYKVWSPGLTENAPIGGARTRFEPFGREFNHFSHWVTHHLNQYGVREAKEKLFDETRKNFKYFLEKKPSDKPFFYWWGPTNTHRSWERGSGKNLWNIEPNDFKGHLPKFLPDVHDVREDISDYFGEVQAIDKGLGVLMEVLKAQGELDNTLIVVSGDHGIPGIPRAKCNLYDIGCDVALAARWPNKIKAGRVVDDFVNLMDLAPTFCEAAKVKIPKSMTAKSLLPILVSKEVGQIDKNRNHVVTGRERHVHIARKDFLPYPQRAIRTKDYIYIINFEPERWPMGDPGGLNNDFNLNDFDYHTLATDTLGSPFPEVAASPTKAWLITHRDDHDVEPIYHLAFGKRPREELYDLNNDPHYMNNIAHKEEYLTVKNELKKKLYEVLQSNKDPRVVENPCRYEYEPYAGPLSKKHKEYYSKLLKK